MRVLKHRLVLGFCVAVLLAGCGTTVPELQEIPGADGERLVQAIVGSIHCEMRNAFSYVIGQSQINSQQLHIPFYAKWLLGWGAQIQITLQVNEQSSLAPSGLYFPMNIFLLGGGGNISASATRIETLNYYYTVPKLYERGPCSERLMANLSSHYPMGSLLIQSDLKLKEWLLAVVLGQGVGDISFDPNQNAKNAVSHEVKFEIISGANVTPTWKLVHATINPNSPLFAASRDRIHDLLITLGPNDPVTNSLGIGTPAANANLAAQIGIATNIHTSPGLP